MVYRDFSQPRVFAQEHLYFTDGIGIQNSKDFRIERKSFRNNLIMVVTEGILYVEQKKRYTLKVGDAVILRLSDAHKYYSSKNEVATVQWMHFGCDNHDTLLSYIESEAGLPYITRKETIKHCLERCIKASKLKEERREYIYSEMIYHSLLSVCESINTDKVISDAGKSDFEKHVEVYMDDHLVDKPDLKAFADACGFSKYHFIKKFKEIYECTPVHYLYRRKIDYSKNRLCYTSDSIALIAIEMGFKNQSHYARVFKRFVGVTPTEHRRSR